MNGHRAVHLRETNYAWRGTSNSSTRTTNAFQRLSLHCFASLVTLVTHHVIAADRRASDQVLRKLAKACAGTLAVPAEPTVQTCGMHRRAGMRWLRQSSALRTSCARTCASLSVFSISSEFDLVLWHTVLTMGRLLSPRSGVSQGLLVQINCCEYWCVQIIEIPPIEIHTVVLGPGCQFKLIVSLNYLTLN